MASTEQERPLPNYLKKLHILQQQGVLPVSVGVHQIEVAHDDWCSHLQGGLCDCEPQIKIRWSVPGAGNN